MFFGSQTGTLGPVLGLLGGSWDLVGTYNWAFNRVFGVPSWPCMGWLNSN